MSDPRVLKHQVLMTLLSKGPVSSITLMREAKYKSKASLANALAAIPNVRRISVDAGCRPILVYWLDGRYEREITARDVAPAIEALLAQGLSMKQVLRELGITQHPDTAWKAIRDHREKVRRAHAIAP